MVAITAELVTLVGSIIATVLTLAIIGIGIIYRDIILSEKARLTLKKNLRKMRAAALLSLMSLYVYIAGEIADASIVFNILPENYGSFHEVSEMAHLALLIVGFTILLQILIAMKGDGQ